VIMVKLNKGDNLAIDLTSDSFDSIVTLLAAGLENDDGPDGGTNSLPASQREGHIHSRRAFGNRGWIF